MKTPRPRQPRSDLVAELAARGLVAKLRRDVTGWHERLARYQAELQSGRPASAPIGQLYAEMLDAQEQLAAELEKQDAGVRHSAAVTSIMRSLDRAIRTARSASELDTLAMSARVDPPSTSSSSTT